ncbi:MULTISPECIES: peptide chain release factor N(5)-glutamine methyltransferase [unclassified Mucilaginibacter]|uniref:peptide chain release factor N(5)-glutamine methyltransferase n=1 Tax=unclassified Mucilaginibacter TaxID=2617802 RepID=UPI002AC895C7|nr:MULTISPECIES: peptide chain release factor N(5)-glutamine methyltransferase [unclassified Mucilaginibacter]MEB0260830.1 peptide chain release factor N(5)-glutamine methyltransferase [Mucilaginibacter sp. 10I4]MEB0279045.1 peptide chain release factor N(5)-glutamine methyltransferase [Mucilaginibacter sp. 10B2]MEB0299936.1 peptide chain release factor N(5)-glutamine methyltransferase [Mucilaginibacter sp. 5C4]WPX22223.1 peptide chain release factor N(5)-glutamine methyltransferase [Mucilagini
MKTIKDVFLSFQQGLNQVYDNREIQSVALLVLEEITGMSRAKIKAFPEDNIPSEAAEKIQSILDELKTGKPVQYILGSTEFYGLNFLVTPATLIPRPETEELVEWVLESQKLKVKSLKPVSILDIGTGSGCIAISIKKNLPGALVTAIDISADALHTAKQNAVINEVEVNFVHDDILNTKFEIKNPKFDIIISNPPYVTLEDKLQMHQNVTGFEPHSALFVPEHDPLIFYKAIADFAVEHLLENGLLFFEINENLGKETVELLSHKGFTNIELRKDMSSRDRMVKTEKS